MVTREQGAVLGLRRPEVSRMGLSRVEGRVGSQRGREKREYEEKYNLSASEL